MVKRRDTKRLKTGSATNAAARSAKRPEPEAAAPEAAAPASQIRTEPKRAGEAPPAMIPCTVRVSESLLMHITTVSNNARNGGKEDAFFENKSNMYRAALQWAKEQEEAGKPIDVDVIAADRKETRVRMPKDLKTWYMGKPRGTCPDLLESAVRRFIKQI